MTQILQYKCPVCAFNLPLSNFIEKPSENFIELGFVSTRECRGKKGMPTISIKSLADYSNTEIGKEAIEKLKHDCLGLIHALEKQGIVSADDFKFKLGLLPKLPKEKPNKTDKNLRRALEEEKSNYSDFVEKAKRKVLQLHNENTELSNALLDASGQIQELQNQINQISEDNNTDDYENEIARLRGIITDYENAALSS